MSYITNVIAVYDICGNEDDHGLLAEMNSVAEPFGSGRLFHVADKELPEFWYISCGKNLECNIAIAAFNGILIDDWIEGMRRAIAFKKYECDFVQLVIKNQDDYGVIVKDVWRGFNRPPPENCLMNSTAGAD